MTRDRDDPLTAYIDDACAMCVAAAARARRWDRGGRLRVRGLADAAGRLSEEDVRRELHVVDGSGRVSRGYDAVVALVCVHPRMRTVAWLLMLPPFRTVGRPAYRAIARRRSRTPAGDQPPPASAK